MVIVLDNDESTSRHILAPYGDNTVSLASRLPDGIHTVTLVCNQDSTSGILQFKGFNLDTGRGLLRPNPVPNRRIEFYGDSVTSGGTQDPLVMSPDHGSDSQYTSNVWRSFDGYMGREMGADYRSISKARPG